MENKTANTFSMKIKSLIEPLKKVSQATEEEHLGTILDLVESSHEPVFIFDKKVTKIKILDIFCKISLHSYMEKGEFSI